jgi:hypothetical protein
MPPCRFALPAGANDSEKELMASYKDMSLGASNAADALKVSIRLRIKFEQEIHDLKVSQVQKIKEAKDNTRMKKDKEIDALNAQLTSSRTWAAKCTSKLSELQDTQAWPKQPPKRRKTREWT